MGNEIIAVPVGEGSDGMKGVFKLNKEGIEILELLKEDVTEEAILSELKSKYDNESSELLTYIRKVIGILRESNALIEQV